MTYIVCSSANATSKTSSPNIGELVLSTADSVALSKEKKLVTALSFPFPLGIVGAHRIFMGAKPIIPVIYIITLGGCFGILPLIDFVILLTTKNYDALRQDKLFMWIK